MLNALSRLGAHRNASRTEAKQVIIDANCQPSFLRGAFDIQIVYIKKGAYNMEKETTPSQSEWLIMEVFWACNTSLTAREVIGKMREKSDMSPRMVRVLLNRLWKKGVLSYTVDEHDLRVYHYCAVKTKEECQKEKSRKFVDSYFGGSQKNAMAALLQSARLTEEQFRELESILENVD